MSPGSCRKLVPPRGFVVSTGSGLQLGWEGEPDGADTGAGERAPDHQEWGAPGSPGQLQNRDQALDVSPRSGQAGAEGAAEGCWCSQGLWGGSVLC